MPFIAFELFHDSVSCGAIDSNVNNSCSQKCSFVKVNVQFVHHWKRPAWLLLVHVSQCSWRPMLRFYWYMYLSALEGPCIDLFFEISFELVFTFYCFLSN